MLKEGGCFKGATSKPGRAECVSEASLKHISIHAHAFAGGPVNLTYQHLDHVLTRFTMTEIDLAAEDFSLD